jgi:predicted dehydrogenase
MFDVLLIGCGNIAGGFDAARPADALPLTHAGAFVQHGGFRIAACVDPDATRRAAFMQRWSVPLGAADVPALGAAPGRFDIVSICSPTALHAAHLASALALKPRLIFCEKPVTPTLAETALWVARCAEAGVLLAVNHTRRWAPDVVRMAEELRAGRHGAVRSVVGHYNKGLLNNGGHLVDLLHLLLGPLDLVAAGAPVWDHGDDDPSVPALLCSAAGVPVHLSVAHAADYALFELQIVTSTGMLTMEDGGQRWRRRQATDSARFKGYRTLDAGRAVPGEYDQAMGRAVANLHAALGSGAPLASSGASALLAQQLCDTICRAARADNRPDSNSARSTGTPT